MKGELLASGLEKTTRINDIKQEGKAVVTPECGLLSKIEALVERECRAFGGVAVAAQIWVERAKSLQVGQGRGKLNVGKGRG